MNKPLFIQPPKQICIIRLSAIGDVTHMLPIIATLQKEWPSTKITWIIGAVEYQLVKQLSNINFVVFNKSNGFKEYLNVRRSLRHQCFDALLMMQTSLRASLISLCVKSPIKLGFDQARAHDYQSLFSNRRITGDTRLHVLDTFFLFLKTLGLSRQYFDWLLKTSDEDKRYITNIIKKQPYIVINPSSSIRKNNYRNWSNESYAEVIDFLKKEHGLLSILSGGPSQQEKQLGQDISQICEHKPLNLIGQTNLSQLLALLEQAQCLIAPDTGPAHMSTIVDTPVIALFASSNPLRTGPYKSQNVLINQYPTALKNYSNKPIEQAKWGERVRHPKVMALVTTQHVKQGLNELLK